MVWDVQISFNYFMHIFIKNIISDEPNQAVLSTLLSYIELCQY